MRKSYVRQRGMENCKKVQGPFGIVLSNYEDKEKYRQKFSSGFS